MRSEFGEQLLATTGKPITVVPDTIKVGGELTEVDIKKKGSGRGKKRRTKETRV